MMSHLWPWPKLKSYDSHISVLQPISHRTGGAPGKPGVLTQPGVLALRVLSLSSQKQELYPGGARSPGWLLAREV